MQYGSPTVELFLASYNNRTNKSKTMTLGVGECGYTHNVIDNNNWFKVDDNCGIYNNGYNYWLASPNNFNYGRGTYELVLYTSGQSFGDGEVNRSSEKVRPIVCISTVVFDSKYTLIDE
ncbi:MAG: hypothetical protein HFJ34_07510 [Clostridia bacterium]|nr:hypothetical protein [Clostridia bacterium]